MTSIVNWLRVVSDDYGMGRCEEAADEIDRLREDNERLREAWMMEKQIGVRAFEKMCELAKALQSIAANTCCSTCREAALVARAALAEKEK